MECCEGGALNDVMRAVHAPLGEAEAVEVVAHTLLALQHCHSNNIIHRVSSQRLHLLLLSLLLTCSVLLHALSSL